jgi:hypothetical protein
MAITIKLHVVAARIQVAADATELLQLKEPPVLCIDFPVIGVKVFGWLGKVES